MLSLLSSKNYRVIEYYKIFTNSVSDAVDFWWYDPLFVLTTFYCEYLITLITSNPDEVITTSRTSDINDGGRPSRIKEGTSTYTFKREIHTWHEIIIM